MVHNCKVIEMNVLIINVYKMVDFRSFYKDYKWLIVNVNKLWKITLLKP